ncbi:MAG TPA: ATP-binding protein, partial [Bacillota bacterium]
AQLYGMVRERLAQVSALKRFTDQLLDRLPLAVVAFGTDGDVRLINQRARVLFTALGLDPARLERLPLRAWVRLDRRWATVDRALRIGGEWEEPALELVLGGERRLFHVYVAPVISHDEKVVAAVGIAWDVTHIHRLEQQAREAERMAAIGQLAAGAAHEIRNPLTAIKGFVQLFQRRARAGEEGEAWNVVLAEIERIERLLRDLLLMAKPQQPERAPCDLNLLVERVLLLLEAQARECGVTIETALEPGLPVLVADGQQLRQVLYNLVLNAIEAMPDGGRLRVETALAGDGRQVVLQVRDTGVGIEPDHLDRVAEPFFTTKAHGTGLGLAVVRSIVNNHGGTIECESQPGRGTTFIVRLPLDGSTATAANRRPDERRPADSRRVLKE